MSCYYHPDRDFVTVCSACGQPVCAECNYVTGTHPLCRRCWDSRVSNVKAGIRSTPLETRKPQQEKKAKPENQENLTADIPPLDTPAAIRFAPSEPAKHAWIQWEPPAQETVSTNEPPAPSMQPKQVEPMKLFEALLQQAQLAPPKPIAHKEQTGETPAPRNEPSVEHLQTAPAELITHHEPMPPAPQVPWTPGEPEIKHIEPKTPQFAAPEETVPGYQQPTAQAEQKPKLDIGTRARSVLGSLSKLRLNIGGKGKQQVGPHYIQVAQQTFQCHQCSSENYIGELFCQTCGAWFQYSCPSCGAVVDPGFDSCPSCLIELGWGMAEEEYHGYP